MRNTTSVYLNFALVAPKLNVLCIHNIRTNNCLQSVNPATKLGSPQEFRLPQGIAGEVSNG